MPEKRTPTRPTDRPPRVRPRAPAFQPRFTLMLLYLVVFYFLFAVMWVLPDLLDVLARMPPGPAQQKAAEAAAHRAMGGHNALYVFFAALAAVGVGAYYRILPGLRPR